MTEYLRDGTLIYEQSFAIIRAEADLSRFSDEEADVAVRMVHACGMVEAAAQFVFAAGVVTAARSAGAIMPGEPGTSACAVRIGSDSVEVSRNGLSGGRSRGLVSSIRSP